MTARWGPSSPKADVVVVLTVLCTLGLSVLSGVVPSSPGHETDVRSPAGALPSSCCAAAAATLADLGPRGEPTGTSVAPAPGTSHETTVVHTLVLYNDTLRAGNSPVRNGFGPTSVSYDGRTAELFVTEPSSNLVSVVRASTGAVVATVPIASGPTGLAYDPAKDQMFVTDLGSQTVSVVSDVSDSVAATIPVGDGPRGVVYDPLQGTMFVGNYLSANVSVISGANDRVIATIPVGPYPWALAYDPLQGEVFVTTLGSDNLDVLSAATDTLLETLFVGGQSFGVAYDPATGQVFVGVQEGSSSWVSVISCSNGTVVAKVPLGADLQAMVYDPSRAQVLVTDPLSDEVSVIADSNDTVLTNVTVGPDPAGMAYDPATGAVYVADSASEALEVLSGTGETVTATVPVGADPVGIGFDPGWHQAFVTDFDLDAVDFVWAVSGLVHASVTVGAGPTSATDDAGWGEVFVTNSLSNNVSVVAESGPAPKVIATIPVGSDPVAGAYDPLAGEVFVVNHYSDNVSVISDRTNSVVASVTVGSDPAGAAYDAGTGEVFVTNAGSNNVSVISVPLAKVVATIPVGPAPTGIVYTGAWGTLVVADAYSDDVSLISDATDAVFASVVVGEFPEDLAYLAGEDEVLVSLPGSNAVVAVALGSDAVSLPVDVGAGPAGITSDAANSSFYVANSQEGTVSLLDTTYNVTFTETGLPSGLSWGVRLNGTATTSATSTITFDEPNGTYAYALEVVGGYRSSPASGTVPVAGAGETIAIAFALATYTVVFSESGLPSGSLWTVVLGTTTVQTTSGTLTLVEPNGSYPYVTFGPNGYATEAPTGTLVITGEPVTTVVTYQPGRTYTMTFRERGLAAGASWCVVVGWSRCSTSTALAVADLSPGAYPYTLALPVGEVATATSGGASIPLSGTLEVSANVAVKLVCIRPYLVTFTETGLPGGTWSVTIGKTVGTNETGDPITWDLPNGTYGYKVGPVTGYTSAGLPKKAVVNGAPTSVVVTFTPKKDRAGTPSLGGAAPVLALGLVGTGYGRSRVRAHLRSPRAGAAEPSGLAPVPPR